MRYLTKTWSLIEQNKDSFIKACTIMIERSCTYSRLFHVRGSNYGHARHPFSGKTKQKQYFRSELKEIMETAKTKKTYKKYLQDDEPYQNAPRTTQWRMKKRKLTQSSETPITETVENRLSSPPTHNDAHGTYDSDDFDITTQCTLQIPETTCVENEHNHEDDATHEDDANHEDEAEVNGDWYQLNDNSVWFDVEEDFEVHDDAGESTEKKETCDSPKDSSSDPLYKGAPISIAESAILILIFAMRHNLTGACLSDLLTLISLHCVSTNFLHLSLYRFRSYFSALKSPLEFHKFCCKCEYLMDDSKNECTICKSDLSVKSNVSYFVEIPLLFQIQQLFQRTDFHLKLKHRFSRKKKEANNIEDIYDGKLYKTYTETGGFLDSYDNISLMWYTDGVPLFKSSKISIWPLFLSINELPAQERFKQENILFAGLWFGKSKPSMPCFLKPFHDSLNKFRDIGYEIDCKHCSSIIKVKGILLCGTCDLPAKCMVMNMTQFNGKYGCPKCKQEGEVVKTGKGHTRVFPFNDLIDEPKRNHKEFVEHGDEAFESSKPIFGVKGPSWWANCCSDIINGTAIDYMHSVLLGLVRRLLQLWFDSKFSSQPFSISHLVSVADKRLSSIKPPYYIKRHPRDIKEQSKYWKASECRAWLFHYSVPVLFGLLKQNIFHHYLLLVEAIYILNLESISNSDLKHCEELLIKYSCMFSALYGEQHMSANLHQLLHMTDTVEQLGPLWVYSCFSFESMNGNLIKLFHGTQNPVIQIANTVSTMLKLPAFASKIKPETPAGHFYEKLNSLNYHYKLGEKICNSAYVIGAKHLKKLDIKFAEVIGQSTNFALGDCYMFYRVMLNGTVYHSEKYNTFSRNSCTAIYIVNGERVSGQIMFYVKVYPLCFCPSVTSCRCSPVYLAVLKKIKCDGVCVFTKDSTDLVQAKLGQILTGILTNDYTAVSLDKIIGLGVFITFTDETVDKVCVSLRPNMVESD